MIHIKTALELEIMADGGKILAGIMKKLEKEVKPGIKTMEIERLAEKLILESGNISSFKGYSGSGGEPAEPFPNCLCVSINEQVIHGIPSDRILKQGDMISLDLGIYHQGFHSDMARTFAVGKVSFLAEKLIKVTKEALNEAIKYAQIGNSFGDIEWITQNYVESQGFNVVRQFCGHGIGKELHEDPQILNFGQKGTGPKIKQGMVFCIEPMVTAGNWQLEQSADGFAFETIDKSLSCHFEDMVAITKNGYLVLTKY